MEQEVYAVFGQDPEAGSAYLLRTVLRRIFGTLEDAQKYVTKQNKRNLADADSYNVYTYNLQTGKRGRWIDTLPMGNES